MVTQEAMEMVIDLTPLLDGRVNEIPVDSEVPMKRFLRNGDELQFDQPFSHCLDFTP